MAPTTLNYSRICHIYNIYSSNNRGVNKKKGAILRYFNFHNIFNVRHVDSAISYRARFCFQPIRSRLGRV